jgi:hypothetical protein
MYSNFFKSNAYNHQVVALRMNQSDALKFLYGTINRNNDLETFNLELTTGYRS